MRSATRSVAERLCATWLKSLKDGGAEPIALACVQGDRLCAVGWQVEIFGGEKTLQCEGAGFVVPLAGHPSAVTGNDASACRLFGG